ncbi:MAG: hypothetical protein OXC53_03525 [Rhodobacteraceae bacterium]|nr:hypothetical protein [Paracoccaceae bacterium]
MAQNEGWMATETDLLSQAGSLGDLYELIRPQISPTLIDGEGWEKLVDRARELPVTMAAFPFGFEVPLHDSRPIVDFGVSLVSGTRTASMFKQRAESEVSDPALKGLVQLIEEKGRKDSPLHHITGPKLLLEFDIASAVADSRPNPGIFLYPEDLVLSGGNGPGEDSHKRKLIKLRAVLEALDKAAARKSIRSQHDRVENIFGELPEGTRILAAGAFPSRDSSTRIAIQGFRDTSSIETLVRKCGWQGNLTDAHSFLNRLIESREINRVSLHLDVQDDGVGKKLGFGIFCQPDDTMKAIRGGGYWLDRPKYWAATLKGFGELELAQAKKLEALSGWSSGPCLLYGSKNSFLLLRGIHHLKMAVDNGRISQIKAYVFMTFCTYRKT